MFVVGGFLFVVGGFPFVVVGLGIILVLWQRYKKLKTWLFGKRPGYFLKKPIHLHFVKPIHEDFRFKEQLRGSVESIMDNIAEGFERGSKLEFINSLTIAKGEAGEYKSQLYRRLDNQYFSKEMFEELYALADELTKMITSFVSYLNKTVIKGQKFKDR